MPRPEFATDVTREQFELVRPMLEAARRRTRPRKHDLYDVFCAVGSPGTELEFAL